MSERGRASGAAGGDRPPHVRLIRVEKRYGGIHALRGVDLEIAGGEVHALVGENGAGKSTISSILAGLRSPDGGSLLVDGEERRYSGPRGALADGTTLISQEIALVPARTVTENVFLGQDGGSGPLVRGAAARRELTRIAEEVGFEIDPDQLVRNLSIAEQRKVEVLRAVARRARLVIMDEPTAALSGAEAERIFAEVRRLRGQGTTVIYISHLLEECLDLADRVTVLKDGRVVRTSPSSEETPESLVTAMLGREQDAAFPAVPPLRSGSPLRLEVRGLGTKEPRPSESRIPIREIDLEVRAGEILGIAGLVGSGRSELARALFGAEPVNAGTIALNGEPLQLRRPADAIEAGIAMIPESRKDDGLVLQLSAAENITLPHLTDVSRLSLIRGGSEQKTAVSLLETVAADPAVVDRPVSGLSGGNQQKVLFGKWLMRRPEVFIADEPTRGIDVGAKRAIYDLLVELAARGMAVVLISSELEEVLELSHRVLVMRAGRLVAEFSEDLDEEQIMRAAFASPTRNDKEMGELDRGQ